MVSYGYTRVSTSSQHDASQVQALEQAGCTVVVRDTISGASSERSQLNALIDRLESGDELVVIRLDRLARSLPQLIAIIERLKEKNVAFRSLGESIDTSSPTGMLVFHIFGALAEFERSLIADRTRAGLQAARESGRVGGRPKALTPKQIEEAKRYLDTGMSAAKVARVLDVSPSTIYRAIRKKKE